MAGTRPPSLSTGRSNPRALLGCGGAVGVIVFLVLMGFLVYAGGIFWVRSQPGYAALVALVQSGETARKVLGEPVSDSIWMTVTLTRSDAGQRVMSLSVPVDGRLRSGTLYGSLEEQDEQWVPVSALVRVDGKLYDLQELHEVEQNAERDEKNTTLLSDAARFQQQGDLTNALASADAAVANDPDHIDAWALRSVIQSERGALDAALADAREAVTLGPNHVGARMAFANALRADGQWSACIDETTALIREHARDGRAWTLRARCVQGAGDVRTAIAGAREACRLGDDAGCALADTLDASR